jgi:uncharacterized protein YbjT (DUF2867 family)
MIQITPEKNMKKAIVIGATGMVGTQLIQLLIGNEDFSEIVTLVRRKSGVSNPKLTEYIINFDEPETWKNYVTGDVLFSTMGTTMAQVKTKKAQYDVDFNYQFTVAKIAANNGVSSYVLVSSAGANPTSKNFYLKMKGELEFAVQSLPFKTVIILQPGQLTGNRIHNRRSEKIGIIIMDGLNKLGLFKRYKPIHAFTVASAMIKAVKVKVSSIYSLDEIFKLAD